MFFWNSLAVSMIQQMLAIWSLVPLPFLTQLEHLEGFNRTHILLKPGLKDFEYDLASVWDECNCAVVWTFFVIAFLGTGMKTDLFKSYGYCWVSQICWHTECSTLTASSFRIWNSSAGIPSSPLALFIVMLPKSHYDFTIQDVWL